MAVYIVGYIDITERGAYAEYEAGFMEVFERYGGVLLAADDAATQLEGTKSYTRAVIARFADREHAMAWYNSSDYQALAAIRWQASNGSVALIDGL